MSEIIDEILKHLPKNKVSDAVFANLIFYLGDRTSASLTYANQDGLTSEGVRAVYRPSP